MVSITIVNYAGHHHLRFNSSETFANLVYLFGVGELQLLPNPKAIDSTYKYLAHALELGFYAPKKVT